MTIAVFLSHLVGDYILQWNWLAAWKSREQKGVLVHGLIVTLATLAFSLSFDPGWWPWALMVGLTHTGIDAAQLAFSRQSPMRGGAGALLFFLLDQSLHLAVLTMALIFSGYLSPRIWVIELVVALGRYPILTYILAYAFIMMPTWVLIRFLVYPLFAGEAPNFVEGASKYVTIAERLLLTTFVVLGQFLFVPLVILPRLLFERGKETGARPLLQNAELAVSLLIALVVALGLRLL